MNAALNKKFRILRAIEGEGEAQKTEDFVVCARSDRALTFVLGESCVLELFGSPGAHERYR
jgi:hypothetical protein